MKNAVVRFVLAAGLAGVLMASVSAAEDAPKTLPTLLIKGEVVSNDTNDPAASLLKVKDRYGFETPIYLNQATKIQQGDQTLAATGLTPGTPVEVEYNFDINTAKRQAVNVKVGSATAASTASAPAETSAPAVAMPAPEAPAEPAASTAETPEAPAAATEQPAVTPQ